MTVNLKGCYKCNILIQFAGKWFVIYADSESSCLKLEITEPSKKTFDIVRSRNINCIETPAFNTTIEISKDGKHKIVSPTYFSVGKKISRVKT